MFAPRSPRPIAAPVAATMLLLAVGGCSGPSDPSDDGTDAGDVRTDGPSGASAAGEPCEASRECTSGVCASHLGERRCADPCGDGSCPDGFRCEEPTAADGASVAVCLSRHAQLCAPCGGAADCEGSHGLVANACADLGRAGQFCASRCGADRGGCPGGFVCQQAPLVDGSTARVCLPPSGGCPCPEPAADAGATTTCTRSNAHGACEGRRRCQDDGTLTACDAATPERERCNGADDDCDGTTDEAPANGTLCDDGNPCTGDRCLDDGSCEHVPGEPSCDDGNPCTVDGCDPEAQECTHEPVPDGEPCDDGNALTTNDACQDGSCVGEPCDCPDLAPCRRAATCEPDGTCTVEDRPDGTLCDDGDPETVGDACQDGVCQGDPEGCPSCPLPGNCVALEGCDEGCSTAPKPDGTPCDDDNPCTVDDTCQGGTCAGSEKSCPGGPCVTAGCDPDTGACTETPHPNGAPCDDGVGEACGEVCQGGSCSGGGDCSPPEPVRVSVEGDDEVPVPVAAVGPEGTMWAAYTREGENDALPVVRSDDGGETFALVGTATTTETGLNPFGTRTLHADADGNLHAVFVPGFSFEGGFEDCLYAVSTDGGASFDGPLPLHGPDDARRTKHCGFTLTSTGAPLFAWGAFDEADGNYSRVGFGVEGSPLEEPLELTLATELHHDPAHDTKAAVAVRAQPQHTVVLWEDDAGHDLYAAHSPSAGQTFDAPVRINDVAGEAYAGNARFAAANDQGTVFAVWRDHRDDPQGDLYLDVSTDGGRTWGEDRMLASTGDGDQQDPAIATLGDGAAFAVWQDQRHDEGLDVYGRRIGPEGSLAGTDRPLHPPHPAVQWNPDVAAGGPEGRTLLTVWRDGRNGEDVWHVYGSVLQL